MGVGPHAPGHAGVKGGSPYLILSLRRVSRQMAPFTRSLHQLEVAGPFCPWISLLCGQCSPASFPPLE